MTASVPRVVVDGSNLATEGRTTPSLVQLDEAVRAYLDEAPGSDVIVVVDASFEHRVAPSERARFKEAEAAGEIVTPPAGAVGRGDAFVLKIASRINAVVLSNDSFQEFHEQYPWLFDLGRLIGGKPVRGVGWIFTERLPVRAIKPARATKAAAKAVKKLAVTLPDGVVPSIGDTLESVEPAKRVRKTAKSSKSSPVGDATVHRDVATTPTKVVAKAKKAPSKSVSAAPVAAPTEAVKSLRRGRHPVNPADDFSMFVKQCKVGTALTGEVHVFTSHGAIINVVLKSGITVECYAPTTALGDPAPARARDVLARGERRSFRLVSVDLERRIAELALI